jgi:hypothetical protein
MRKFDKIFESVMWELKEQNQKPTDDLKFNVKTMVLKLQDPINGYIGTKRTAEEITEEVLANHNVLDIGADEKTFLPRIRLQFSQSSEVESFEVQATVLAKNNAIKQPIKKFKNSSPESICDDVVLYLDEIKMQMATGDASVKNTPQEQGAQAQPGAEGGTALPTAATGAPPPNQQPNPQPQQ